MKNDIFSLSVLRDIIYDRPKFVNSSRFRRWRNELANAKNANREPSLLRALLRMFASQLLMYGLMQILIESVLR